MDPLTSGFPSLPGLERLLDVCMRLELQVVTSSPGTHLPAPSTLLCGEPLDPLLAAFYSRFSKAMFAADIDGLGLYRVDELTTQNRSVCESWQRRLFAPLSVFGGEPGLAHYYATVPGLADRSGYQPVVWVSAYEQGYALPVASTVDRLFHTYSRFLEAVVADEDFQESGASSLHFPWGVPHLIASDGRLVQLLREGRFDPLLREDEMRDWAAKVIAAAPTPPAA